MGLMLESPYSSESQSWLRGNLHTHTRESDGPATPQETIDIYAGLGYDFLMLSDHDMTTSLDNLEPRGLTLISGNEITGHGPHLLHVGTKSTVQPYPDRQRVLDAIRREGGFAVFCHPNWESHFNHCPQEKLMEWQGYAGIEIYNGVVSWLEGNPNATDRWDRLLGAGRRVLGFANDDCHVREDMGVAWNVVQSESRDADAILGALRAGRFYASTGVRITRVQSDGAWVAVETEDASRISVFSDFGYRRAMADSPRIEFQVPDDASYTYVRVECSGCGDRKAWTQPLFIRR